LGVRPNRIGSGRTEDRKEEAGVVSARRARMVYIVLSKG